MSLGIFCLSGKPVHQGHWEIIKRASTENDDAVLFVSLADRKRQHEKPIYGQHMKYIWENYLVPILPLNVEIDMCTSSPIQRAYAEMGELEKGNVVNLYAGKEEILNSFSRKQLNKYLGDKSKNVNVIQTPRVTSGTHMRELLTQGYQKEFCDLLPHDLNEQERCDIWKLLY